MYRHWSYSNLEHLYLMQYCIDVSQLRWKMSAPHIFLDCLPSLCQKLSDLAEVWRSYNKNNFAFFSETWCIQYNTLTEFNMDFKLVILTPWKYESTISVEWVVRSTFCFIPCALLSPLSVGVTKTDGDLVVCRRAASNRWSSTSYVFMTRASRSPTRSTSCSLENWTQLLSRHSARSPYQMGRYFSLFSRSLLWIAILFCRLLLKTFAIYRLTRHNVVDSCE